MKTSPGRKEARHTDHQTDRKRGDLNRNSHHKMKSTDGMEKKK